MKSGGTRGYRMSARAEATAATGERILEAATELFWERPADQVSLTEVAARAGVTPQTVIRRFGGKDGLMAAAVDRAIARTGTERRTPPDDPSRAVAVLLDHYEAHGRGVLRLLAAEESSSTLAEYAERGRRLHRDWCGETFPAALQGLSPAARRRRLSQIVAVCDVYTWRLLRIDGGLSRAQTRLAVLELLEPLLTTHRGER